MYLYHSGVWQLADWSGFTFDREHIAEILKRARLSQSILLEAGLADSEGQSISLARRRRHLSQQDLAERIGALPIDDNWIENRIRPNAIGRSNCLFAGSLRAGKRAAAVMSLIQSAKMNGHDPYAYIKDVLTRLPTQKASQIEELLPHRWQAINNAT